MWSFMIPGAEDEAHVAPVPVAEDLVLRGRQGRETVLQLYRQGGGIKSTHLVIIYYFGWEARRLK